MKASPDILRMIEKVASEARGRNTEIPDPDEVLKIRCPACEAIRKRPRRVIERDTLKQGFWVCGSRCLKAQKVKRERFFSPMGNPRINFNK